VSLARVLRLALAGAVFLTPLAAVAQEQNVAPVPMTRVPPPKPMTPQIDRDFVAAATASGESEIAQAKLALEHSSVDEVRGYATKMIEDHTTIAKELAAARGVSPNAPMPPLPPSEQLALAQLRGDPLAQTFDEDYALQQVGGHLAAVTAFNVEAKSGTDPKLRAFAAKWIPTIQAHLELAVTLAKHVAGDSPFR
jgi:putative membrane protein